MNSDFAGAQYDPHNMIHAIKYVIYPIDENQGEGVRLDFDKPIHFETILNDDDLLYFASAAVRYGGIKLIKNNSPANVCKTQHTWTNAMLDNCTRSMPSFKDAAYDIQRQVKKAVGGEFVRIYDYTIATQMGAGIITNPKLRKIINKHAKQLLIKG